MVVRGRDRPTHLVSKNRKIRIWHRRLGHASNSKVIRASTLVDGINPQQANYNLFEVFLDLDESEHDINKESKSNNQDTNPIAKTAFSLTLQSSAIDPDRDPDFESLAIDLDLDKLCTICMTSKSTRAVKHHKSMTLASKKLEEVHADL